MKSGKSLFVGRLFCGGACDAASSGARRRDDRMVLVVGVASAILMMLTSLFLSGCASKSAKPAAPAAVLTADEVRRNVESFDIVWETIRDKHFDAKLNGADWDGARAELRPKVEAATTMDEARAAISELIGRLKQSHFGIIPRESYAQMSAPLADDGESGAEEAKKSGSSGRLGLMIRAVPTEKDGVKHYSALVVRVEEGSAAAAAGVKAGSTIERVGKVALSDRLGVVAAGMEGKVDQLAHVSMVASSLNSGTPGKSIDLTLREPTGKQRKVKVAYAVDDTPKATFGNLPSTPIETESKTLESGIGYARLSIWLDPPRVSKWFDAFMKDHADAKGVIIDLRGNPGGLGAMAMGMGGHFTMPKNTELGTQITRTSTLRFVMNPRPRAFGGKLAILTDELSMSTSEIFAGGMKDIGRARVFGTATPGAALPSAIERLPNGDGFQYAFANYISAGGKALEGLGVQPDEVVGYDAAELRAGRDPVVEAAVKWILSEGQVTVGGR
jgi:carboxyl-terminal processing protease